MEEFFKKAQAKQRINSLVASGNAEELVKMGEPGIEPLTEIMRNHRNNDLRMRATEALAEIGSEGVLIPLIEGLQDKDVGVQNHAAIALGELKHPGAVEPLIKVLKYPHEVTRECAARALGKIGDQRAVEPLTLALNDGHAYVREAAAFALERMNPDSRWGKMLETLRGLKPTTKQAIGQLRERHAEKLFTDPSEVINNIQDEYESYFRITSTSKTPTSITLVFDNFVESGINDCGTFEPSAPATRELEITIVTDGGTFYVIYTETRW